MGVPCWRSTRSLFSGKTSRSRRVVVLAHLERVGEHDAGERLVAVAASAAARSVVGGLDVDRGDVVGEQQDLVGVQLVGVLAGEVVRLDQAGLEQPDDEGAGAGEGVEDVDALVGEACAEVLAQHVVGGAEDEVDDLDRRVDDAELSAVFGKAVVKNLS